MSQPKKKTSRRRRDLRRYASNKIPQAVAFNACPESGESKRTHTYTLAQIRAREEQNTVVAPTIKNAAKETPKKTKKTAKKLT